MNAPVFATLGCRLNAYETEAMKELSAQAGVSNAVIVNTCAVTAEAVRKARQEIRKLRDHLTPQVAKDDSANFLLSLNEGSDKTSNPAVAEYLEQENE